MKPTLSAADMARGKPVPWVITAFFISFIVPLVCFAWIAFSHKPSEVTEHAYDKGLVYNRTLEEGSAQAALGWQATLAMKKNVLTFVLIDKDKKPIRGAEVKVWFLRASEATLDQRNAMHETAPGRYEATLASPVRGLWEAHVTAKLGDKQFQAARSFNIVP